MQTKDRRELLLTLTLLVGTWALEALLLRLAGPPSGHLHALAELTSPMAEPLDGILAALALSAQALAAYLVLALALRASTHLPGLVGQVADQTEHLLTVPAVRRGLDALLGGVLIAQLALTPTSAGAAVSVTTPPPPAAAMTSVHLGQDSRRDPAHSATAPRHEATRPPGAPPRVPSVPLPIWLGATAPPSTADDSRRPGTGTATVRHRIQPGETLWTISAAHLPADAMSERDIARYWRRIHDANRGVLGPDPDLIHPGVTLSIPPNDTPAAAPPPRPGMPHTRASAWPRSGGIAEDPPDRLP